MLELALATVLAAAVVAPHVVPLRRVAPATAAVVWLAALLLRALLAIGGAVFLFVYLPQTELFDAIAAWCWHAVIPILTEHLRLSGHPLADAATILPALVLACSVLWVLFGLMRAALALRRWLSRHELGAGPSGTTLVDESEVLLAVTRLGPPKVVVSQGAVAALDEDELNAGLAHEWGHVRRRHRPVLVVGVVLRALGRLVPGTRAAERELVLALERDADEHAVRETGDALALASAICKVALTPQPSVALAGLGGGAVSTRLSFLVGDAQPRRSPRLERGARALACLLITLSLALAGSLPLWAVPNVAGAHAGPPPATCPH